MTNFFTKKVSKKFAAFFIGATREMSLLMKRILNDSFPFNAYPHTLTHFLHTHTNTHRERETQGPFK